MKILNWLKENYILTAIICIGTLLRFYHLDYQSLWIDEIHTINETNPDYSFAQMSEELRRLEPHPRLYFILIHFVFKIFGYSSFILRMFSAILGIAGIAAIYHLGKELYEKRVGLFAATLLAINCFHLAYSQEGRMYALFFLCTTLSFYALVRLIKEQNTKTIAWYVITTTLMLYCHLFALFALCAQIIILLFFMLNSGALIRKRLFYFSLIAGAGILILYIPNIIMLQWVTEVKSSWIPTPALNVYRELFYDFFGRTELAKLFIGIPIITYFIFLFREKGEKDQVTGLINNKMVFSFIILFTWLFITLLLPFIRSHLSTPMMINRYFINVLPPVILIVAIGLYCLRHRITRITFLLLALTFTTTDMLIVENYYTRYTKSQFRDLSLCLIDKNKKNEALVSELGWYLRFYFRDATTKPLIHERSIDTYVEELIKDSTKRASFWYAEMRTLPAKKTTQTLAYLEKHFTSDTVCKFYKAFAIHYETRALN